MRYIRTTNNIAEFIETDSNGGIISARGFQFGELYYQIKNKKVTFYLNDQENPFRNDIWTLDIPFEMDGVVYDNEDDASAHLHAIFNDRFQEQLDQLKEDLAAETARAQQAEEDLGEEIDDERDRAISAETHLQTEVTELSGLVSTFDGRITACEEAVSALSDDLHDEIARSTAKDAEHDAQISGLTDVINSEIQRALSAETTLHNEILAEESRAFLAESGITNNLNNEISRSTQKDAQHDAQISALTTNLSNEIQRATEAENWLRSDLNDEIADRISGDTNLQTNIDAEVARATAAESALTNNLNAEILRSTNKDSEHDTLISGLTSDLATETQNRIAGDNLLQTNLNNEIARATSAETVLHNEIISERDRALVAESSITNSLNAEIARSTSKDASHDAEISGLSTSLQNEISRSVGAENSLRSDLNSEISARTDADTAIVQRVTALEVGKADKSDVYTKAESDAKYTTKEYMSGFSANYYDKNATDALLANKADASALTEHVGDNVRHITAAERTSWNNKSDFSGSYNDLTDKPTIPTVPTNVSAFVNDAGYITSAYTYNKTEVNNLLSGKADPYSAGTGIDITNNVISATGGSVEYSAGTNVQINNHIISATDTKYTAGDGISISNSNVISSVTKFWCGTEQQWAAISGGTLDANTIYMVH